MIWFFLTLLACQVFYDEDETTKDLEIAKVASSYNSGINAAAGSSVRIDVYAGGHKSGHGSGNLFKIGTKRFVITAAHVIEDSEAVVIREKNKNLIPADVVWANLHNDIAVLLPLDDFESTKAISYVNNRKRNLDGEKLYHHAYPSEYDGLLVESFVSKSGYFNIIVQSQAWFGSSGSVAFDTRGRAIGIVHAINVEMNPATNLPDFMESMVFINRLFDLSRKDILGILKDGNSKSRDPN